MESVGSGLISSGASSDVKGLWLAIGIFTVTQQVSARRVHDMTDLIRKSNDALGYADEEVGGGVLMALGADVQRRTSPWSQRLRPPLVWQYVAIRFEVQVRGRQLQSAWMIRRTRNEPIECK